MEQIEGKIKHERHLEDEESDDRPKTSSFAKLTGWSGGGMCTLDTCDHDQYILDFRKNLWSSRLIAFRNVPKQSN